MGFVLDSSEKGLRTIMKDYQAIGMRLLWEKGEEGASSRDVWTYVNKILLKRGESISRASIILFMQNMIDKGAVNYFEITGKGGHHRIYYPVFDEAGFKEHIAKQFIEKLLEEFPDETGEVLRKIFDKI